MMTCVGAEALDNERDFLSLMPKFDFSNIRHGQHNLVLLKDRIEPGREYVHQYEILDVADKGKGAMMLIRTNSYLINEKGEKELAFYNDLTTYYGGIGGFGFKGKGLITELDPIPKRKPDAVLKGETYPGQAFVYRLSGDYNPLHVDVKIAKMQKMERPIIHGKILD